LDDGVGTCYNGSSGGEPDLAAECARSVVEVSEVSLQWWIGRMPSMTAK